jgi:hypothetical protein
MEKQLRSTLLAGIGTIAILGTSSPRASCSVRVLAEEKASERVRIVTEYDGKPLSGSRIEVYRRSEPIVETELGKPLLVVVSDALGHVVLPKMSPGKYHVIALAKPNLRDEMLLDVSHWHRRKDRELTMYLAPYVAPPTYEELIAIAESSYDIKRLTRLRGLVRDQSGAPITQASVDVIFRGTGGMKYAARLHTDQSGRFASDFVPEGAYIAAIRSQGFSTKFLSLIITERASDDEVKIELAVAPASE